MGSRRTDDRLPLIRLSLGIALLLGTHSLVQAQTNIEWTDPVQVGPDGSGWLRPRIALNAALEPVVLWGRSGPAINQVAVGQGAGFMVPVEVSVPGLVPSVADWMGSAIASSGNTVWIAMKATPEESRPVYVRRSDDGGLTWGDTLRVDPFDGLVSRFPTIALVGPDEPVIQYMQFDNGWNGAREVVTRMAGGAFEAPVQVSTPFSGGEVCDCCPTQIVADGQRVSALYRNAESNLRVMWGAVSADGASSFPVGAVVDTTGWVLNACPSSGPAAYFDGDSIRYTWMSGANNGTKIYLGAAHAGDLGLGPQYFVHPGQSAGVQQNFPRIAGNGDTLGVVWENYLNGAREILFAWSVTGPAGLSVPVMVNVETAGNQRTPDIAFADGTFHIVWGEQGANAVRYRTARVANATGVVEREVLQPAVWFDAVTGMIQWSGAGAGNVEVVDALGRRLASAQSLMGRIHWPGPAGVLIVRVPIAGSGYRSVRMVGGLP